MKSVRYFFLCAGLSLAIQVVVFSTLGRWNAFLDKCLLLYYPTIWLVERCGNFAGESNLIEPILIGVPLGVFLYSIAIALTLTFSREMKRN
jgi:hypothetical protein